MFKWNIHGDYQVNYDPLGFPVFKDYIAEFGDINVRNLPEVNVDTLNLTDLELRELATKEYNKILQNKKPYNKTYEKFLEELGFSEIAIKNIKEGKSSIDGYTWHAHQGQEDSN